MTSRDKPDKDKHWLTELLNSPWSSITAKAIQAKEGKPLDPITLEEVAEAIEQAEGPPPPIVRPIIAQMVRRKFKSQKGIKAKPYPTRRNAAMFFIELMDAINKRPDLKSQSGKRGDFTLRKRALDLVAEAYFVDARTLENWIKEHGAEIIETHRRDGIELQSLSEALTYERNLLTRAKHRANLEGWPLPPLK